MRVNSKLPLGSKEPAMDFDLLPLLTNFLIMSPAYNDLLFSLIMTIFFIVLENYTITHFFQIGFHLVIPLLALRNYVYLQHESCIFHYNRKLQLENIYF